MTGRAASGRTLSLRGFAAGAAAAAALLLASPAPGAAAVQQAGDALPPDTGALAAPGDARVDSLTARVSSQLRCPVCRSQSVLESSSDLANRMQALIRERLARGESPAEVRAYFVDKYGEWILLKPQPEGLNLLVYVLPALALVGGGWAVARRLRRWSTAGVTGDDGGAGSGGGSAGGGPEAGRGIASDLDDLSPEDRAWLEREMERRRS